MEDKIILIFKNIVQTNTTLKENYHVSGHHILL